MTTAYDIRFLIGSKCPGLMIRAEVTSPLLDTVLHPAGSVTVLLGTRGTPNEEGFQFGLESFQMDSLAEYVRKQAFVRKTLEVQLAKDRANYLGTKKRWSPKQVWVHAKVAFLLLDQRRVPDVKAMAEAGMPPKDIRRDVAMSNKANTRSCFVVGIEVDWEAEHGAHTATFRDGRFVEMGLEGSG